MKKLEKILLTGITLTSLAFGTNEARGMQNNYDANIDYSFSASESPDTLKKVGKGFFYASMYMALAGSAVLLKKSIYDATQESMKSDYNI